MRLLLIRLIFIFFLPSISFAQSQHLPQCDSRNFNVGVGIEDITGPAAEEGMMGYAMIAQKTAGILQRLWARAFIIESPCNGKRIVFVNTDLGMLFQGIKQQVIKTLREKYGDFYRDENVLITATHSHSGPGGYSTYALYNLTTFGFDKKNFYTIANGIVKAIENAQQNMVKATIRMNIGELKNINYNRSPTAYIQNPLEERNHYVKDISNKMTLIRFDKENGEPLGLINWFPIHGVSMNNKNYLINGDNKGYAEYLFEKDFHSDYGPHSFVAAFAQTNAGDVSSNPLGTAGGCGIQGIQKVEQAGKPQYEKAKELFDDATTFLAGDIDYRHVYVEMDKVVIHASSQHPETKTCSAAIGISMLAGTQDGEGVGEQGMTCEKLQKIIPRVLCGLTPNSCQGVKPIILETGKMKPYPWTPNILPLQILKIGQLIIVAAPFELTTMTGRRIREAVAHQLGPDVVVVLSTLANAYAGYVATDEEYQLQRYEGASTHFGPWTQKALVQEFVRIAQSLQQGTTLPSGPEPPDLIHKQMSFQPPVLFDHAPHHFGDIKQDVKPFYKSGDTVEVVFWGGHPKNNYRTHDTFLEIQRYENGKWKTIRNDNDWDTEYHWKRNQLAHSLITIVWRIPKDMPKGKYRVVHYGDAKLVFRKKIIPYRGYSSEFNLS